MRAVDAWANPAATGAYNTQAVAQSVDIDQDGVPEYLLYNDRVFAEFKGIGGRMVNAWVPRRRDGRGVPGAGKSGGLFRIADRRGRAIEPRQSPPRSGTPAYRTSGFKDLFAQTGGAGTGNNNYVNNIYTAAPAASGTGWTFTSSDGLVTEDIRAGRRQQLVQRELHHRSVDQSIVRPLRPLAEPQ